VCNVAGGTTRLARHKQQCKVKAIAPYDRHGSVITVRLTVLENPAEHAKWDTGLVDDRPNHSLPGAQRTSIAHNKFVVMRRMRQAMRTITAALVQL
jgi:hypothetical protein